MYKSYLPFAGGSNGAAPTEPAERDAPEEWADFNGDGRSDLAVGSDGWKDNNGAAYTIYGTRGGLDVSGGQQFFDYSSGQKRTGDAVTAGDYNGDGLMDLSAGMPDRSTGGSMLIIPGYPTGPSVEDMYPDSPAADLISPRAAFGSALR